MKKIILIIIITLFSFIVTQLKVEAASEDQVKLIRPSDEVLNGVIPLRWYANVTSEIELMQLKVAQGACESKTEDSGEILNITSGFKQGLNEFFYSWDISRPLLNRASLESGDYCLRLYVGLVDETTNLMSEVDIIIDRELNVVPRIINTTRNFFLTVNSQFVVDIDATDPDTTKLIYKLIGQPDFIQINPDTGVINVVENPIAGSYRIIVEVDDNEGGIVRTPIAINLRGSLTEQPLNIRRPIQNSIIFSDNNSIEWNWKKQSEQLNISITANNGVEWKDSLKAEANLTTTQLDINEITAGTYYMSFSGELFTIISESFYIDSDFVPSEPVNSARIFNVTPANNQRYSEVKEVSGFFELPEDVNFESIEVKLNDTTTLNNCVNTQNQFSCVLSVSAPQGNNKLVITLRTSDGSSTIEEVIFIVGAQTTTPGGNQQSSFDISAILPFCLGGFILIAILFVATKVLPGVLSKRKSSAPVQKEEQIDYSSLSTDNLYNPTYTEASPPDPNFDPYSIGSQSIENQQPVAQDAAPVQVQAPQQPQPEQQPAQSSAEDFMQEVTQPTLPSAYTADPEELPDWLKDNDSSDPVGVSKEEIKKNRPLEGTQPYGMSTPPDGS